ncbi:MAG: hypothetical protein AAB602_02630 [Patescibacteria group bacterium]
MFRNFRREVITGAALIIGSIIVFGVVFYFFSRSLNTIAREIAADRLLIANNAVVLGNLAELKRDDQKSARYEKAMNKLLVPKDQLIDFDGWLEGLARVRQVAMNFSFSGSEVAPQENFPGYISFSLDIAGTLDALTAFLKDIELQSTRFLVNLDTFDVTRSDVGYRIITNGKVFFK